MEYRARIPACSRYAVSAVLIAAMSIAVVVTGVASFASASMRGTAVPLWHMTPWLTGQLVMGIWLVVADVAAAVSAVVLVWCIERRALGYALICFIVFLPSALQAFRNHIEFAYMEQSSASLGRGQEDFGYQAKHAKLLDLEQQREWVAKVPPIEQIAAQIARLEGSDIFANPKRTNGCAAGQDTLPDSKELCGQWRDLRVQRASAERRARLTADIDALRAEMAGTKRVVTSEAAPRIAHDVFGIPEDFTKLFGPLLTTLMAFGFITFGPIMLQAIWKTHEQALAPPAAPRGLRVVLGEMQSVAALPASASAALAEEPAAITPPVQAPSAAVPPPEVPVQAADSPAGHDRDKIGKAAIPDDNVTIMVPKVLDAQQGVAAFALQVQRGRHQFAVLQARYDEYCERRRGTIEKARHLGRVLRDLGYRMEKDTSREGSGKNFYHFPLATKEQPMRATG